MSDWNNTPCPEIDINSYFCELCGANISRGVETMCASCDRVNSSIIVPLEERIKALEEEIDIAQKRMWELEEHSEALEGVVEAGKQYLSYGGKTHHKDGCRPKDKCECGLWELQKLLKEM